MSRGPETVGPKIQSMLQREIGLSAPIPWSAEGQGRGATVRDGLVGAFGGKLNSSEYKLVYEIPTPRPVHFEVAIIFCGLLNWLPGGTI